MHEHSTGPRSVLNQLLCISCFCHCHFWIFPLQRGYTAKRSGTCL
jgi:hypothetical protein